MTEKTWDEMLPNERRVALALDVIEQVKAGRYDVKRGYGYVSIRGLSLGSRGIGNLPFVPSLKCVTHDESVTRDDVKKLAENCSVCARGALLLSRIDKFNRLTWRDIMHSGSVSDFNTTRGLRGAFSIDELSLIESVFENDVPAPAYAIIEDPAKRLIAIMKYIAEHDGHFNPADKEWTCEEMEEAKALIAVEA